MGLGAVGLKVAVPVNFWLRWAHRTSAENVRFLTGVQRVTKPSIATLKSGLQRSPRLGFYSWAKISYVPCSRMLLPAPGNASRRVLQWYRQSSEFCP